MDVPFEIQKQDWPTSWNSWMARSRGKWQYVGVAPKGIFVRLIGGRCECNLGLLHWAAARSTSKTHSRAQFPFPISEPLKCAALEVRGRDVGTFDPIIFLSYSGDFLGGVQSRYKPIKIRPSVNLSDSDIKFIMLHIKPGHKLWAEIIKWNGSGSGSESGKSWWGFSQKRVHELWRLWTSAEAAGKGHRISNFYSLGSPKWIKIFRWLCKWAKSSGASKQHSSFISATKQSTENCLDNETKALSKYLNFMQPNWFVCQFNVPQVELGLACSKEYVHTVHVSSVNANVCIHLGNNDSLTIVVTVCLQGYRGSGQSINLMSCGTSRQTGSAGVGACFKINLHAGTQNRIKVLP